MALADMTKRFSVLTERWNLDRFNEKAHKGMELILNGTGE